MSICFNSTFENFDWKGEEVKSACGERVGAVSLILYVCSHEIRRQLLLGRKAMISLDSALKSRDITQPTKVQIDKATVFLGHIWLWELDCKEAECQRTDVFKLWCWRWLLRVPWTARSNQSILREISPEYHWKDWCWSWSFSILVTWCKQLTHWKNLWCWERLRAEEEGLRKWDG